MASYLDNMTEEKAGKILNDAFVRLQLSEEQIAIVMDNYRAKYKTNCEILDNLILQQLYQILMNEPKTSFWASIKASIKNFLAHPK